jgi:hypothetical protein
MSKLKTKKEKILDLLYIDKKNLFPQLFIRISKQIQIYIRNILQ